MTSLFLFSFCFKMSFSDYIVYVDESGDPSLAGVNDKYPVFVLAFCIFSKNNYAHQVVSDVEDLKFKYFGHDMVILHEREILKSMGAFKHFNKEMQNNLLNDLSILIEKNNFILVSCVIHKQKLLDKYTSPENPYYLAMRFGLERVYNFLQERQQKNRKTFFVFEQRGLNEDKDLELEFRRVCDGQNAHKISYPFEIIMASKKVNSTGLQFADLVARPIGNHILKPEQPNRAFEILKHKFYCKGGRENTGIHYDGYGLKVFPK